MRNTISINGIMLSPSRPARATWAMLCAGSPKALPAFVGSGIFKASAPEARARAIVKAATYFNDPAKLLEASEELGMGMIGLDLSQMPEAELLQTRGW